MTDELRKRIAETIAKGRVMLFMKGNPAMPQCGFSAAVVSALKETGVPFETANILADQELREGLKEYSSWPTFPQLYVDSKHRIPLRGQKSTRCGHVAAVPWGTGSSSSGSTGTP